MFSFLFDIVFAILIIRRNQEMNIQFFELVMLDHSHLKYISDGSALSACWRGICKFAPTMTNLFPPPAQSHSHKRRAKNPSGGGLFSPSTWELQTAGTTNACPTIA